MEIEDLDNKGSTFYVFSLANDLYAIETEWVKEIKVGHQNLLYPILDPDPALIGTIDSGVTKVPVLDLRFIFKKQNYLNQTEDHTIIIVEETMNKQKKKCGLLVNDIIDMIVTTKESTQEFTPHMSYVKKYFISDVFSDQMEVVKILDVDALLERSSPLVDM